MSRDGVVVVAVVRASREWCVYAHETMMYLVQIGVIVADGV